MGMIFFRQGICESVITFCCDDGRDFDLLASGAVAVWYTSKCTVLLELLWCLALSIDNKIIWHDKTS